MLLEIKMLLQSTDLSVQEIAYRLHFPDQSYLGRYFKKHTGESPHRVPQHEKISSPDTGAVFVSRRLSCLDPELQGMS